MHSERQIHLKNLSQKKYKQSIVVVVVKAVVTRNKPKKISSRCKKLENNIFVVTHSNFVVILFFKIRRTIGPNSKNSWNCWIIPVQATNFECKGQATGNGSYVNLHNLKMKNSWKSLRLNGLVVVVKAVVTRSKPKKIPSRCKKLENDIFVVTHSDFSGFFWES